jgi:hypothetical protein
MAAWLSVREPLLNDDLPDFLDTLKGLGFSVKLDSTAACGRLCCSCGPTGRFCRHGYKGRFTVSAVSGVSAIPMQYRQASDHQGDRNRITVQDHDGGNALDSAIISVDRQDICRESRHVVQV